MKHPAPKEIGVTSCRDCAHLGFAYWLNQEDQLQGRQCDECNSPDVGVFLYRLDRELKVKR